MIPRFALPLSFVASISLVTAGAFADDKKNDPDEIGNRDVGGGVNFYSIQKEIALGKQMAQEVERQSKVLDDPVIAEYVSRIGQNLVRNSDAKVPFTIKVLDTEEVNAFALPGGFFFVNSGLILKADSEAELAGRTGGRDRTAVRAPRDSVSVTVSAANGGAPLRIAETLGVTPAIEFHCDPAAARPMKATRSTLVRRSYFRDTLGAVSGAISSVRFRLRHLRQASVNVYGCDLQR
jgi:hypothetical protein